MKYFLPDWDERVDPHYDFVTDRPSLMAPLDTRSRDPYSHDIYVHEAFDYPPLDGMLVSRTALGRSGPKRALSERIGMRAYLRLPPELQLLGDSGAFSYVHKPDPIYATQDMLDFYERLDFDLGVSVDHLIVTEHADQTHRRSELTLRNADEFLALHRRGRYTFAPIGAVQGWDVASYVEAARSTAAMGYDYLALGGLTRRTSRFVREVVGAIVSSLPSGVRLHVFGVARVTVMEEFLRWGIASIDSASPIRQAWLSSYDNYYTLSGTLAALRIPIADQERVVSDSIVARSTATLSQLRAAEKDALRAVRSYARRETARTSALDALMAYDGLLAAREDNIRSGDRARLYARTLSTRAWEKCRCQICRELGVEVVIFRGDNRNRRRGFHNLWVVQQRLRALGTKARADSLSSVKAPTAARRPGAPCTRSATVCVHLA